VPRGALLCATGHVGRHSGTVAAGACTVHAQTLLLLATGKWLSHAHAVRDGFNPGLLTAARFVCKSLRVGEICRTLFNKEPVVSDRYRGTQKRNDTLAAGAHAPPTAPNFAVRKMARRTAARARREGCSLGPQRMGPRCQRHAEGGGGGRERERARARAQVLP